jgi:nitroreductase
MADETIMYIVIGVLVVAVIGLGLAYIYKPAGSKDSFLANLEWRRATKHFAPGEVDTGPIELAMINAPSSFGLQPYSIVRVTDPDLKKKMRPFCFDQEQVETCHVVYVLCALKDVEKRVEQYLTETKAEPMRAMIKGFLDACPDKVAWAAKQAYITLGFGLAAAAERRINSCPMEGFLPDKVAELLALDANLAPVVLLCVGQPGDNSDSKERFRFSVSDLMVYR